MKIKTEEFKVVPGETVDLGKWPTRLWDEYMHAYEECLTATSTAEAPWHIVPADDKKNARLIISEIILDEFKSLKMEYPELSEEKLRELQEIRAELLE